MGEWTKTKLMLSSTQVEVVVELKLELSLAKLSFPVHPYNQLFQPVPLFLVHTYCQYLQIYSATSFLKLICILSFPMIGILFRTLVTLFTPFTFLIGNSKTFSGANLETLNVESNIFTNNPQFRARFFDYSYLTKISLTERVVIVQKGGIVTNCMKY